MGERGQNISTLYRMCDERVSEMMIRWARIMKVVFDIIEIGNIFNVPGARKEEEVRYRRVEFWSINV